MLCDNNTIYGLPSNTTFADVWGDAATFVSEYKASGLYNADNKITDTNATVLYYLLYARFGNNSIASRDTNRFKYAVFANIFQYGPAWEKKLDLQKKVRALTDAELQTGSRTVQNHAYNPGTAPAVSAVEDLTAINEQSSMNYVKSKIEAYGMQWEMISNDVTNAFVMRFEKLFIIVAAPVYQIAFPVEEED